MCYFNTNGLFWNRFSKSHWLETQMAPPQTPPIGWFRETSDSASVWSESLQIKWEYENIKQNDNYLNIIQTSLIYFHLSFHLKSLCWKEKLIFCGGVCERERLGQLRSCCVCGCVWSDERTLKVTGRSEWSVKAVVHLQTKQTRWNRRWQHRPDKTTAKHHCMICVWTFRDSQHKNLL